MKKTLALCLQTALVLLGLGAAALLLWEPHLEGRNVNASTFEIYFKDPFLAYAYVASIPFFVGVYQAVRLAGLAGRDELFSRDALRALQIIKHCAAVIVGFVLGGEVWILLQTGEDRAGGVAIGILIIFSCLVVAAGSAFMRRALEKRA